MSHALPLQKISSKSVHKFASNPTDRETDKQTDRQTDHTENITSFFGGGNKKHLRLLKKTRAVMLLWANRLNVEGGSLKIRGGGAEELGS